MIKVLQLSGKLQTRIFIVLIASVVFACYMPTLNNGFVWDDEVNFNENFNYRGLSTSHLNWMFTTFHDANYHPLAWLTLGFDFVLWEMNPAGYHLTNVVLHVLNAVLFFFLIIEFLRLTFVVTTDMDMLGIKVSAIVAALFFAIHPLRVETVSWISTRGDLLCGVFYLLTIIAYVRMNNKEAAIDKRKWFLLSMLFFVFSLISRAWGITLPLVLLILDVYPIRRLVWKGQITSRHIMVFIEKIPYCILAMGAAIMAIIAKKEAILTLSQHGLSDRIIQSTYGLCFYLLKTIMPIRLSPLYLLDNSFNPVEEPMYILCILIVLCISVWLVHMKNRWPWAITAWVCYVVIVSPLLGFVQSGPQIVADRYTYIACLPIGVLAGAGMLRLWTARKNRFKSSASWNAAIIGVFACLLFMSGLCISQSRIWKDKISLWNHVLRLDSGNYIAHDNLGIAIGKLGRIDESIQHFLEALRIKPDFAGAYLSLGNALEKQGRKDEAIDCYLKALRIEPDYVAAHNNLGIALGKQGRLDEAIGHYLEALRIKPDYEKAHYNIGDALEKKGRIDEAIGYYLEALRLEPYFCEAHNNLGNALQKRGRIGEAIGHYLEALRIKPDYVESYSNLGNALEKQGLINEAINNYLAALRIKPDYWEVHYNLGNILKKLGRIDEAIDHYLKALRIKPRLEKAHNNLGIALICKGNMEGAIYHFQEALRIKPDYLNAKDNLKKALMEHQQGQ